MNMTKELLQKSKGNIILAMLISAVSAMAGIGIIAGINYALQNGLTEFNSAIVGYISLLILLLASGVASQILLVNIGHNMVYHLRKVLVARVLNTPIEHQEKLGGPAIYNILTRDVTMVSNAAKQVPVALYNVLLLLIGLGYLCWLSPVLFGMVVVVVIMGVWSDSKLTAMLEKMLSKVRQLDDRLFTQYEAVIEGRNELALNQNRRQHLFNQQFVPTAQASKKEAVNAEVLWALNLNWTTLLIFSLIGVIFFMGMSLPSISQETVVGYILAIMFLRTPLSLVLDSIPAIIRGRVALVAINKLQLAKTTELLQQAPQAIEKFSSLTFNKITYQYPDQEDDKSFQLGPIDFKVQAGELVFLIGGNGSGKSTLAKLLSGLYLPSDGEILLNNQPLNSDNATHNTAELRHYYSAIFPNFFLFDDVIDQTGDIATNDKITHYLQRLAIDHKVNVDNGRLSTTSLSQGQRKRLALLLAYMEDRQIILLDEWAADQDPLFREVFYREILPELKAAGKTVIAITHDDHYFDIADSVYKLDSGKLSVFNREQDKLFAI